MCWLILFSDCLPSNTGGSLRPLYPMTQLLFFLRSSLDKSPLHILFSICPYCGSCLKQCLLFSMITTFMLFSQTPLDKVANKSSFLVLQTGLSWWKSPENMMENQPKNWFLFLMSLSFMSSILSLTNDISSITRICTSCHSFLLSWLSGLCWLMKAAFKVVTPLNNYAANPV